MRAVDSKADLLGQLGPLGGWQLDPKGYYAFGKGGTVRWLIPRGQPVSAVLRSWQPHRPGSALAWRAVRAWARLSALRGRAATIRPLPVIYIGTPGPRRKAVCHMVSGGRVNTVIKIPLAPGARSAIVHEAAVLGTLEQQFSGLRAPRLLELDETRAISVQTWLAGAPGQRRFGAAHAAYLKAMRAPETIRLDNIVDEALANSRNVRTAHPELAAKARDVLETARQPLRVPAYLVHGDFAAWNLKLDETGLAACDWEETSTRGLPLQDLAHFFANDAFLFGVPGNPFERLLASAYARDVIADAGLDTPAVRSLLLYYCGATALRSLERDEPGYAAYLIAHSPWLVGKT